MDITEFDAKFKADEAFRTMVLGDIATELKKAGLTGPLTLTPDDESGVKEFVYDAKGGDIASQLAASTAAMNALKSAGVTDFSGMTKLNPKVDPYAWNVVYKGGGWVVNGLQAGEFGAK